MNTVQDFNAEYTVYSGDTEVRKFKGNIWAFAEIYRLIFGPGSSNTSFKVTWKDKEFSVTEYVNWQSPGCCDFCKIQSADANKILENSLSDLHLHD